MFKLNYRFHRYGVLVTATFWTLAAIACNVPVFRYALERWEADPYEIVVFEREPLSAEQEALLAGMEKAGRDGLANLTVNRVSLAGEVPAPLRSLGDVQKNLTSPWMVLRYPRQLGIETPAWAGGLSAESVATLLDSPARRDIAQKLLSGDAVVWLLLESGDQQQDDQAERLIETETSKLQQTLKLPEPSPQDPPMNANLPLKIAFSTVRVGRSDPAERVLVNLLLNWNPKLLTAQEAMLFPIFGRGRVIPPAIGPEIRAEAMREMAEFLTGPCSCQIKEMNPGYDLLLTANWSSLVGYQEVQLPEPPALVSLSQFADAAASKAPPPPTPASVPPTTASVPPAAANAPAAPVAPDHLVRNLIVVLGAGACFLTAMTFGLKLRANRSPPLI